MVTLSDEPTELDLVYEDLHKAQAEIERLRADNERLKEWCRKLIEAGEFQS